MITLTFFDPCGYLAADRCAPSTQPSAPGLDAAGRNYRPDSTTVTNEGATISIWVAFGNAADLARFTQPGWVPVTGRGPVLTDDYPDLLRALNLVGG